MQFYLMLISKFFFIFLMSAKKIGSRSVYLQLNFDLNDFSEYKILIFYAVFRQQRF